MQAKINDIILADSRETIEVEGNQYFPPASVNIEYLFKSPTPYTCPWKGECQYWNVVIEGVEHKDAAWSYPEPKAEASHIAKHIAFDPKRVTIEE